MAVSGTVFTRDIRCSSSAGHPTHVWDSQSRRISIVDIVVKRGWYGWEGLTNVEPRIS